MKNVLYLDVKEFTSVDSLILTYYLVNGEITKSDRLITKDINFLNEFITEDILILSLSNPIELKRYVPKLKDIDIHNLCEYLNYPIMCLYDLFSLMYGFKDGITELDMIKTIILSEVCDNNDNLAVILDYQGVSDSSIIMSYSLLSFEDELCIKSNGEFIIDLDIQHGSINISRVFKDFRYSLALYGYSLRGMNLLFFSQFELNKNKLLFDNMFSSLVNKVYILTDILSSLEYVNISSYKTFVRYLSNRYKDLEKKCAGNIASVLLDCYKSLGLIYSYGSLRITNTKFRKDFSTDRIELSNRVNCTYGIILDCEGTIYDGCTQVGGVIFCRKGTYLIKMETFLFDNIDIVEGFKQIFDSYEKQIQRYIPNRGIDILVYGRNDDKMIQASFSGKQGKQMRRKIEKYFHFTDCRSYIDDFIDMNKIVVDNHKLSTVAKSLGVLIVEPKHDALNDSKTLFNVLAQILLKTEEFII